MERYKKERKKLEWTATGCIKVGLLFNRNLAVYSLSEEA